MKSEKKPRQRSLHAFQSLEGRLLMDASGILFVDDAYTGDPLNNSAAVAYELVGQADNGEAPRQSRPTSRPTLPTRMELRSADSEVRFTTDARGISGITVGSVPLLGSKVGTGGGYIEGSTDGHDARGTNFTSVGADGATLVPRDPSRFPADFLRPLYDLGVREIGHNAVEINLTINVRDAVRAISVPFDFATAEIDSFWFEGNSYRLNSQTTVRGNSGGFDEITPIFPLPGDLGKVGVARTNVPTRVGELRGDFGVARVEVLQHDSNYKSLNFFNHPGTRNIEIAFDSVPANTTVELKARLSILPGESEGGSGSDEGPAPAPELPTEPTNRAPNARRDRVQTSNQSSVIWNPIANDSDPDGDRLRIDGFEQPANGTVRRVDGKPRRLEYTPEPGFVGDDFFFVTITDGKGGTDRARQRVIVSAPEPSGPTEQEVAESELRDAQRAQEVAVTQQAAAATDHVAAREDRRTARVLRNRAQGQFDQTKLGLQEAREKANRLKSRLADAEADQRAASNRRERRAARERVQRIENRLEEHREALRQLQNDRRVAKAVLDAAESELRAKRSAARSAAARLEAADTRLARANEELMKAVAAYDEVFGRLGAV